jgi:Carbohydrate binding domain
MRASLCCALLCLSLSVQAEDAKAPPSLLKPINVAESWRFEQHEGGKGTMKVEGETVTFTASELDGTDWHVQVFQIGLDLKDGEDYTFTFEAKSPERRAVIIIAGIDQDDYHEIGLHEEISAVSTEYKKYEYTFRADGTATGKNRIGFVLGTEKGSMTIKSATLTRKPKS